MYCERVVTTLNELFVEQVYKMRESTPIECAYSWTIKSSNTSLKLVEINESDLVVNI